MPDANARCYVCGEEWPSGSWQAREIERLRGEHDRLTQANAEDRAARYAENERLRKALTAIVTHRTVYGGRDREMVECGELREIAADALSRERADG